MENCTNEKIRGLNAQTIKSSYCCHPKVKAIWFSVTIITKPRLIAKSKTASKKTFTSCFFCYKAKG